MNYGLCKYTYSTELTRHCFHAFVKIAIFFDQQKPPDDWLDIGNGSCVWRPKHK